MDSDIYQRLIESLDHLITKLDDDAFDYTPMIDSFVHSTGEHIMALDQTHDIDSPVNTPRDLTPDSDTHKIVKFKGKFEVPEISHIESHEHVLESKEDSGMPFPVLPIIPIIFPFLPTFWLPERWKPPAPISPPISPPLVVPTPIRLPKTQTQKDQKPVERPVNRPIWDPAAWATYGLAALLALKDGLESKKRLLEQKETWLVVGLLGGYLARKAIWYQIGRLAARGPGWFKAAGAAMLGIGTLATAQGAEEETRREGILEDYVKINIDLDQVNQAIILKQLEQGARDPMSSGDSLPPSEQLDPAVDDFYDKTNWFHDFPGDWSQMRRVYFNQEQTGIVDDDPNHSLIKVNPSVFYEQLKERAETEKSGDRFDPTQGWTATRKLHKISKAIEFFGNRSGVKPGDEFQSGHVRENAAILYGEYEHLAKYPAASVKYNNRSPSYIEAGKAVPMWIDKSGRHPEITDVDREHFPEISKKIQSNIIRDDNEQYERLRKTSRIQKLPTTNLDLDSMSIRKINELLEDYIISRKRNQEKRSEILTEIEGIRLDAK